MKKQYIRKRFNIEMIFLPDYLVKQAQKGLFLKKLNSLWLCFEKGEPQRLDYKLVPINNDEEYQQIKNLQDWEIVKIKWGLAILSAPENTPFNIIQDHNILLLKLSYMRTFHVLRFCIAAVGLIFSLSAISQYRNSTLLFSLSIILSVLLFGFAFMELYPLFRLQKSIRTLQNIKDE